MRVAHVVDAEDKDVRVCVDAFLDLCEQALVVFAAGLFGSGSEGDELVALGTRHCGLCWGRRRVRVVVVRRVVGWWGGFGLGRRR